MFRILAEDAKKLAEKNFKKKVIEVHKSIEGQAKKGRYSLTVTLENFSVSTEVESLIKGLRLAGYEVTFYKNCHYVNGWLEIEWR